MRIFLLILIVLLAPPSGMAEEETVVLRPYKRQVQLTGFTGPKAELTVSGELSGRCSRLLVDRGDIVPRTGVVAELDATFVRLDLAKNSIARQQAGRELALEKKTLSRYTNLMKSNSAAEATFDEASLRADLLELRLQSLKNEEGRLQEMLKRHSLRGPPGWQVIDRFIEEGAFVHQGEPVMLLGDFRQLLVPFALSYTELLQLQQQEKTVLWFPELQVEAMARVYRVSPDFDERSRKIPVELIIERNTVHAGLVLRGGLRVQLNIAGLEESGSFVVPHSALISRYEAHWLVQPDGKRRRVILTGLPGGGAGGALGDEALPAIVSGEGLASGDVFLRYPEKRERQEQPGRSAGEF